MVLRVNLEKAQDNEEDEEMVRGWIRGTNKAQRAESLIAAIKLLVQILIPLIFPVKGSATIKYE